MENINNKLFGFITDSPSCFHAVENIAAKLTAAGAVELFEGGEWSIESGCSYFVRRNGSSIIAFAVPEDFTGGFMITAAHSDSPTFKIKDNPELEGGGYLRINTERYGGMILDSWFDRPLSAAGRLVVRTDGGIRTKLVSADRDLMMIPHLAIHMQNPNEGIKYNPASDLVPLCGLSGAKGSFMRLIAELADVRREDILGHDLFLVNRQAPTVWGAENEFISAPKLDDLECAFLASEAFVAAMPKKRGAIPVMFIADNEEVGSVTKQGAESTFLKNTLTRLNSALGRSESDFLRSAACSMLLSADNAHAVHPNHPELADSVHRPLTNAGVVMKFSASQSYTTDAVSAGLFRELCRMAEVPVQIFHNRSDMRGGSTLGNLSNKQVSLNAVDIGIAQLAMHSSYETAGALDSGYMLRAMTKFFELSLSVKGDETLFV